MKHWIIRFINSSGFVTEAIDWATNSLWDHTEMADSDGSLAINGWIGAHDDGGVQNRPADYCTPTRERRYAIPVTEQEFAATMAFAKSKIGTPYNFADIAGLLLKARKINSVHRLICSQFVTEAGEAGGIRALNVEPGFEYLITPESLHLSPLLIGNCIYASPEAK